MRVYLQETIIDALKNYESRDAINIKKQKSILDTLSYTKKLTIADVFAECEKDIESQKKLKSAAESGRSSYLKNFLKKSSVARALVGKVYYNDPTSVNTAIDKIAKAGRVTKLLLRLFCGSPSKFTENCPEPYSPPESKQAKGSNPYTNNVFSGAAAKKVDVSLKITAPEKTPDNTNIGDQQQQQPPTAPKKPEEGSLPPNTPAP